jgi:hypothetical protein
MLVRPVGGAPSEERPAGSPAHSLYQSESNPAQRGALEQATVFSSLGRLAGQLESEVREGARTAMQALGQLPDWTDWKKLMPVIEATPGVGPLLRGALAAKALAEEHVPWVKYWGVDLSLLEGSPKPGERVKTLAAPGGHVKYLIVSDLHRDTPDDAIDAGPINHFSKNKALYKKVVQHALDHGHTLIENGDAEEFWAVPDLNEPPERRAREILKANADVYALLGELCGKNRYHRTQGNHDSPLGHDNVWKEMRAGWADHLELQDFLIIPGVKTMDEFTWLDFLRGRTKLADYVGLDPNKYQNKKCLIVCHGHQFDFWNCPPNEVIGRSITEMFRYADGWMDQVLKYEGIHAHGNPLIDFQDFFGDDANFIFNHWLEAQPALAKAHQIQHLRNRDRLLRDSPMFSETLLALLVTFGMPLANCPHSGKTMREQLGHGILIGHTHYPQSQPHYPLGDALFWLAGKAFPGLLEKAGAALRKLVAPVRFFAPDALVDGAVDLLKGALNTFFKTRYFNSGVTGWHKGVIYAIEITVDGQARLLYWTADSAEPKQMDWELSPEGHRPELSAEAAEKIEQFLQALRAFEEELKRTLQGVLGIFGRRMDSMLDAATKAVEIPSVLGNAPLDLGSHAWAAQLQVGLTEFFVRVARMVNLDEYVGDAPADFAGARVSPPPFEFHLPWTSKDQKRILDSLAAEIAVSGKLPPEKAHGAPHAALVWMFAQEFAPYYGTPGAPAERPGALSGVGGLLSWLPIRANIGPKARFALHTQVTYDESRLRVRLSLVAPTPRKESVKPRTPAPAPLLS